MEKLYESIFPRRMTASHELCISAAVFSATFFLTHAFLRFLRRKKHAGRLPPALPSVPILGSLPFLPHMDQLHNFFMQKAQELGPVFVVNFSNRLGVIISGREMIHEAFVKQSLTFASRPQFFSSDLLNPGLKGILERPYDSEFRRYHQLSLNILKKFGFGKGIMESRIHIEVEDLLAHVQELNGKAFCPGHLLTRSVSNVIVSIILGERYDHSSSTLTNLIEKSHEFLSLDQDVGILNFFPMLRFLPKYRRSLIKSVNALNEILEEMSSKIDAGLKGELPESFITHFLEMEGSEFDRGQLLFTLRDFYMAGTETSASTLQWALVLLASHPGIQQRLQNEIDSVVSRARLPSLDDKAKLPFTEAVILELMRIKTVVPLGLFHAPLHDTSLNGYFIPKGSLVIPNLYAVHMDPTVWQDPHVFSPERFLDPDGRITKKDQLIPFSLGRRSCLGELLAQQEIFLFLTGLVQHFNILPPEGQSTVFYKEFVGITMAPTNYQVRLLPRHS